MNNHRQNYNDLNTTESSGIWATDRDGVLIAVGMSLFFLALSTVGFITNGVF